MPRRNSKGGKTGISDWSKHEMTLANILHKEIFETGRYFRKTEINVFKKRKSSPKKKLRGVSEEDEGFEEGTSNKPYVKMVQISSRDYLDQLHELIFQLEERVNLVSEEVTNMEMVEKRLEEVTEEVTRLIEAVTSFRRFKENQFMTEDKLKELQTDLESCSRQIEDLDKVAREQTEELGQPVSSDIEEKLSYVKLITEKALSDLDLCEMENKKIRQKNIQTKISTLKSRIKDRDAEATNVQNKFVNKIIPEYEIDGFSKQLDKIVNSMINKPEQSKLVVSESEIVIKNS